MSPILLNSQISHSAVGILIFVRIYGTAVPENFVIGMVFVSFSFWNTSFASSARSGAYKVPFIGFVQMLPPKVARLRNCGVAMLSKALFRTSGNFDLPCDKSLPRVTADPASM